MQRYLKDLKSKKIRKQINTLFGAEATKNANQSQELFDFKEIFLFFKTFYLKKQKLASG